MRTIKANTDLLSYLLTMIGFEKTFLFEQMDVVCFDNNPRFPGFKLHQNGKHLILFIKEFEINRFDYTDFCNFVSQDGDEVSLGLDYLLDIFHKTSKKIDIKKKQLQLQNKD
jgi:hypothetical protein